eukprot:773904-Amphidinium_carterae.1
MGQNGVVGRAKGVGVSQAHPLFPIFDPPGLPTDRASGSCCGHACDLAILPAAYLAPGRKSEGGCEGNSSKASECGSLHQ